MVLGEWISEAGVDWPSGSCGHPATRAGMNSRGHEGGAQQAARAVAFVHTHVPAKSILRASGGVNHHKQASRQTLQATFGI